MKLNSRQKKLFSLSLASFFTAGAILLCGFAPVIAFRLQDKTLFDKPHTYSVPTGQLPIAVEDIPLVRNLYNWEEGPMAGVSVTDTVLAMQDKAAVATLLPRTKQYVQNLVDAGVFPVSLQTYLEDVIFTRTELNYTHIINNYGRETINCNLGMGAAPPFFIGFTIDMATGYIVWAECYLPVDAPIAGEQSAEVLQKYLAYLGLGIATDWQEIASEDVMAPTSRLDFTGHAEMLSLSLRMQGYVWQTVSETQYALSFGINSFVLASDEDLAYYIDGYAVSTASPEAPS